MLAPNFRLETCDQLPLRVAIAVRGLLALFYGLAQRCKFALCFGELVGGLLALGFDLPPRGLLARNLRLQAGDPLTLRLGFAPHLQITLRDRLAYSRSSRCAWPRSSFTSSPRASAARLAVPEGD